MTLPRRDAVEDLRLALIAHLRAVAGARAGGIRTGVELDKSIRWRPHVWDHNDVAWHILSEKQDSDFWIRRLEAAVAARPAQRLGIAMPESIVYDDDLLRVLIGLDATVAVIAESDAGAPGAVAVFRSAADVICEKRLRLSPAAVSEILDRLLERCKSRTDNNSKGVTLEVLTAVLLSQVDGFEVRSRGVSNRTQQMDVMVHNRNTAGALGRSEIVIAEAKNWNHPPGTTEYYALYRKIETKFGRSRLGYFVTIDRFTRGVELERLRDSKGEILVVPLDKRYLPELWRGLTAADNLTGRLEKATLDAAMR